MGKATEITEKDIRGMVSEAVGRIVESYGVPRGLTKLCWYILDRCDRFVESGRFERMEEKNKDESSYLAFIIPVNIIAKYTDKVNERIYIERTKSEDTAAAYGRQSSFIHKYAGGHSLSLGNEFWSGVATFDGELYRYLIHELTHLLNSNGKEHHVGNVRSKGADKKVNATAAEVGNGILYYYSDTEMNARIAAFYYELKGRCDVVRNVDNGEIYFQCGTKGYKSLKGLFHACDNSLDYRAMTLIYNTIVKEENAEQFNISFDFDSFPSNGNIERPVASNPTDNATNIFYVLIRDLSNTRRRDVFRVPTYKHFFGDYNGFGYQNGSVVTKYNNGNEVDRQALEMKYNQLKAAIQKQVSAKYNKFVKRAYRVAYEWYQEQVRNNKVREVSFRQAPQRAEAPSIK